MPIARALSSLLVPLALAGMLAAQGQAPRFVLPQQTLDYSPIVPAGHPGLTLPTGNDPATRQQANDRATLGRVLFYDRLLSRNEQRSCASCHQQKLGFADGHARSRGFDQQLTHRNAMAIANLAGRQGFFWDQRARYLDDMVLMPISNPIEMGLDLDTLRRRLSRQPEYAPLFERAYGDPTVTVHGIAVALADFVAAIVSLRSKYDAGLAGAGDIDKDFANFTPAENRGKKLFFGNPDREHSCAICHVRRLFAKCGTGPMCGNGPWSFDLTLSQSGDCHNNGIDAGRHDDDPGRGGITDKDEDRGKFVAPSLRNIELTGPYMHDGRFATLEQVLDFYAHRVRPHRTLDAILGGPQSASGWSNPPPRPPEQMPSIVGHELGMALSSQDRADLLVFLKTLTDRELLRDQRFADPFARPTP